jgi:hypothetical protein
MWASQRFAFHPANVHHRRGPARQRQMSWCRSMPMGVRRAAQEASLLGTGTQDDAIWVAADEDFAYAPSDYRAEWLPAA